MTKAHVIVTADNNILQESVDYSFDSKGSFRILKDISPINCLVVKRATPPAESTIFALEELRDEIRVKDEESAKKETDLLNRVDNLINSCAIEADKALKESQRAILEEVKAVKSLYEQLLQKTDTITQNIDSLHTALMEQISSTESLTAVVESLTEATDETFKEVYDEINKSFSQLSFELRLLRQQDQSLQNRLKEIDHTVKNFLTEDSLQNILSDFALENNEIKTAFERKLKETVSALNTETQIRRREDAQIKSLLKRLLGKYDALRFWIAGSEPDLEINVLSELKGQMQAQDDKLGRVHLENITRINALKEHLESLIRGV